jgi:sigma-B regulation protein RsbU (phosphoserine phosphatase)
LLQIQGSVAEVKLDLVHQAGHTLPVILNAVRREHTSGVFHELAVFVAEDRHKYEREHVQARKRAEELLVKQLEAQQALTVAQARLRLALDSAQLFVWDVDPDTGERRYEEEVARLLGFKQARLISDQEYHEFIEPGDRDCELQAFLQSLNASSNVYRCVYRLNGVDGVQRTVSSSGRGLFNADGTLHQFVGVLQDITELSRQRAEAEDRALFAEQMVGIVSHDLRNPLSAVRMGTALLERGEATAGQVKILGHINHAVDRAQRLIADLLDFTVARVGQGIKVSSESVNLYELVAGSVTELTLAFPDRTLEHRHEGQGICFADPDRLTQLIGNLVSNAMTYGATEGAVTITSKIVSEAFSISVHNCGEPIPADRLPSLFEPMTRGEEGGNKVRSVGLGLFIVREIVRAHEGTISVTSTAEHGTTFTARFPCKPD